MTSEVTELISALRNGTMNLDEVAQRFRSRSWPRRAKPAPTTYQDLAAQAQEDPPADVPNSFDDVDNAYFQGLITEDQYDVLARAMAESMRAEDQRRADGAADSE